MGWTYTCYINKPKTMKEKRNIIADEVNRWYKNGNAILHDCLVKDDTDGEASRYVYYASIETKQQERVILVILLDFDEYRWGYKDMCEDMCPGYFDCPLIILKDVPCPDHEWAIEWRKTVMERHYKKNAKKALIKSLKVGDEIEFTEVNYGGYNRFKVSVIDGKNIYFAAGKGNSIRGYTLTLNNWKNQEFKVYKAE